MTCSGFFIDEKKMKRNYCLIIFILLLHIGLVQSAIADTVLRVGVFRVSPFAFQADGVYTGLAIDLWQTIAEKNGWKYKYVMEDTKADKLLQALQQKKLDVVVGSISVTHKRLKVVDFSRPYYINPMILLVSETPKGFFQVLWSIAKDIFNYRFHLVVAIVVFFIFINLLWWVEKGKKDRKKYREKMKDLIWDSCLIILAKPPAGQYKSWIARLLIVIMMFIALILAGVIIATFSSALTLSLLPHNYTVSDMEHKPVAVGSHTFQQSLAQDVGLQYLVYPNMQSEIHALLTGEVEGVMMDLPAAHYYLKNHNYLHLTIAPFLISYNEVAFAFQLNSPYTRLFNLTLTAIQDKREAKNICKIYIGEKESDLCNL